jgi:hypothetical protein
MDIMKSESGFFCPRFMTISKSFSSSGCAVHFLVDAKFKKKKKTIIHSQFKLGLEIPKALKL